MSRKNGPTGTVLYTARSLRPLRILQFIGLALAVLILLGVFTGLLVVLLVAITSIGWRIVAIAVTLVVLAVLLAFLALSWRSFRISMTVTTDGIMVCNILRDRWIPWERVQIIETGTHLNWSRATSIVTTDGERIEARITAWRSLYFRGEFHDAAARDPRIPQLPTRCAIDAHRRYLRGEFSSVPRNPTHIP